MKGKIIVLVLLSVLILGVGQVVSGNQSLSYQAAKEKSLTLSTGYVTLIGQLASRTFQVEVARTDQEKAQGLSGRNDIADGEGMLFIFDPPEQAAFWMKEMRFSLDMIWIKDGRIIAIDRNLPLPQEGSSTDQLPTYRPPAAVEAVLEIKGGAAADFQIGDKVEQQVREQI